MKVYTPTIDKLQWIDERAITLRFQCGHFTECFKQKDSVINTSAITAVTKSPWSHEAALPQIVSYRVVEKGMENKGEQR